MKEDLILYGGVLPKKIYLTYRSCILFTAGIYWSHVRISVNGKSFMYTKMLTEL